MDLPMLLPCSKETKRKWMVLTHGTPGLVVSACLGHKWVVGWCAHIALDTISHADGGATGKGGTIWLP